MANGTGAAPLAATPDFYRNGIPHDGILGASVPGIVDALLAAHERYGSLDLITCLEPAIELCEDGVPVTRNQAANALEKPILHTFPTSAAVYAPHGQPLKAGRDPPQSLILAALIGCWRNRAGTPSTAEQIAREIVPVFGGTGRPVHHGGLRTPRG